MISDGMADALRTLRSGDARHLAQECARALDATGVAISLLVGDTKMVEPVWCFPEVSVRFEELQFTLGEGPGHDASRSRTPVVVPELSAVRPERWPALVPAARELGELSVSCFPLGIGAIRTGVLTVLCTPPRRLSPQQYADAAALASALTAVLLNGNHRGDGNGSVDDASALFLDQTRELRRAVVHQATGMISVQLAVPLSEALVRLRAFTFAAGRALTDVAEDVVARRLRFDDDESGPVSPDGGKG
ncbi:ANTAR domain-containing protein [Streptomyces sp. TRM66268-LWL]|uniref:ANTAR domain-containing protein n=1 Tax=Streptomyces polyasparticus TaxID=2767826 RepID=A0ABR7SGJ8_9ACTN|nr:ANTAR domain-containing protein [Streptomyces polyasparticus]MBC9714615.1 ANTAR domain-containing protein [Streptomyces polyasparticus]